MPDVDRHMDQHPGLRLSADSSNRPGEWSGVWAKATTGAPRGARFRRLAAWAGENAEHYATMGMEYAGELFARVMGHQAADGAYFTRPGAARLLSELALDEMGVTAWNDTGEWPKLKVADLACGSGDAAERVDRGGKGTGCAPRGADDARCAAWHKKAVEELTTGLDINPVSLQLAAGRFTLGNLDVDYRKMALHCLEHGRAGADVRLGTLELLGDDEIIGRAPETFQWDDDGVHPDIKSALTGSRAVVMNPPFSDNTKRNRNVEDGTKKAMQRREMAIRDRVTVSDAEAGKLIDTNSIRTFFTPLIDAVIDQNDGVLAKILPMTACTAASGVEERQFLATRFHVKYVVTCHDPRNINLSQETSINECLLIATRKEAGGEKPTTFVNLSRYPAETEDARGTADAIRSRNINAVGRSINWPADRMRSGDWSPVQWYAGELAKAAWDLKNANGLCSVKELYKFGPPTQKMILAFEPMSGNPRTRDEVWMFRSIKEKLRQHLTGEPEERWQTIPLDRRDRNVRQEERPSYLDEQGWMLAAQRFRTTSSRTVSQYCDRQCLGTAYVAIRTETREEAKALNLLWNSTPALVQLLSMRSKTAAYPNWSIAQLQSVRLPAEARDPDLVQALAGVHDDLAELPLGRLSDAAEDPVRVAIDDATAALFGWQPDTVSQWRKLLSEEPFMHNSSPVED